MSSRLPLFFFAAVLLFGGLWLVKSGMTPKETAPAIEPLTKARGEARKVMVHDLEPATEAEETNRMVHLAANQVLASVNGREIKPGDLAPSRGTNEPAGQVLSRQTYDYLLQRAIQRELVLEAAKAQGIELSDGDKRQLAGARAARGMAEPGQAQRLTLDKAQLDFEMHDAEAFLLQSALLASTGASPNVTPEQVASYYQDHAAEFAGLPSDEQGRKAAWAEIDVEIRQRLAMTSRSIYQSRLTAYMKQLEAGAAISITPLSDP